jgi:hypothetical protein
MEIARHARAALHNPYGALATGGAAAGIAGTQPQGSGSSSGHPCPNMGAGSGSGSGTGGSSKPGADPRGAPPGANA